MSKKRINELELLGPSQPEKKRQAYDGSIPHFHRNRSGEYFYFGYLLFRIAEPTS